MGGGRPLSIKRNKLEAPDVEKTLANWARNHQRQGFVLIHALIKEKVHFFAVTYPYPDENQKIRTEGWLEGFMQKSLPIYETMVVKLSCALIQKATEKRRDFALEISQLFGLPVNTSLRCKFINWGMHGSLQPGYYMP